MTADEPVQVDLVLRVDAKLLAVAVQGRHATITLMADRTDAVNRLISEVDNACLVGFVFEPAPDTSNGTAAGRRGRQTQTE